MLKSLQSLRSTSRITIRSLATIISSSKRMLEQPTPERIEELKQSFSIIQNEVNQASIDRVEGNQVRLVAVSKVKPSSDILALYNLGVRHFGENYPVELVEKAAELPSDIQWHFIGALQSNKAKMLASIPNLFLIETLTSLKSADILSKTVLSLSPPRSTPLNVFLQINTSSEDSKSGLLPLSTNLSPVEIKKSELISLARHVLLNCPGIRLKGLMTIGSFTASHSDLPNPDFTALIQTREKLLEVLTDLVDNGGGAYAGMREGVEQMSREGLELSMGMSEDFVKAIGAGSTNVRVGSRIFGARPPRG